MYSEFSARDPDSAPAPPAPQRAGRRRIANSGPSTSTRCSPSERIRGEGLGLLGRRGQRRDLVDHNCRNLLRSIVVSCKGRFDADIKREFPAFHYSTCWFSSWPHGPYTSITERISVADLLAAMQDRALAALMFIFAVPNVVPVPPGTSAILGAPFIFLAAQLTLGRRRIT